MKAKVYLVMCVADDLERWEDHRIETSLRICFTRERAQEYVKNWQPYLYNDMENPIITDDISEIKRLTGKTVDTDGKFIRHVYLQEKEKDRSLFSFYIKEEEVAK